MATFNESNTQKELYLRLYALYDKILGSFDGNIGEGLDAFEFTALFNDVKEFNDLLERFRPNQLKFNPLKAKVIKEKISLWYEDGPAFMTALLRIKYKPIYKKSKRILYEIAKQFVVYPNKMTDLSYQIPKDLDKIFDGLTSDDPADGYLIAGKPYLDKFSKGNVSMPLLKKLLARYVMPEIFDSYIPEISYENHLNEGKRRGFYNPFDETDEDGKPVEQDNRELDPEIKKYFDEREEVKNSIQKIEPWDRNKRINKVEYQNGKMIATDYLFPRDIIEKDPVQILSKSDMSSRKVRDMAFEIVPNLEWGIPVGYCGLYRRSDEVSLKPNVEYQYDKTNQMIIIKAIERIPKGTELILKVKNDDYGNLYKKDAVKLDNGNPGDFKSITAE